MATKRNPEERSPSGPSMPGEAAAQPTGEEVFEAPKPPRAASTRQARTTGGPAGTSAGENVPAEHTEQLQALAAEYYDRLADTAEQLNQQVRELYDAGSGYVRKHPGSAALVAFGLGVLLGFLSNRD